MDDWGIFGENVSTLKCEIPVTNITFNVYTHMLGLSKRELYICARILEPRTL